MSLRSFSEIEHVLEIAHGPCRERLLERHPALDGVLSGKTPVVIYPSANMARHAAPKLQSLGIEVLGLGDSNPALRGTQLDGLPVFGPKDIASFKSEVAVLVASTMYDSEIAEGLSRSGCATIVPVGVLNLALPDVFESREYFGSLDAVTDRANHEAIRYAYSLMADEQSRRVFASKLLFYLTQEKSLLDEIRTEEIYFDDRIWTTVPGEVIVDGGAYTGDTLESFLSLGRSFRRYYAFEPDSASFSTLSALPQVDGCRVIAVQAGLAEKTGRCKFAMTGTVASKVLADSESSHDVVDLVSLDDYFLDKPIPTFIKLDIEGAEAGALLGAEKLILSHAPKLTICAYHYASDLWELPALVHRLNPGYSLFMRHHTREVQDTVCYAIPSA